MGGVGGVNPWTVHVPEVRAALHQRQGTEATVQALSEGPIQGTTSTLHLLRAVRALFEESVVRMMAPASSHQVTSSPARAAGKRVHGAGRGQKGQELFARVLLHQHAREHGGLGHSRYSPLPLSPLLSCQHID
jgi:hypothetical protein